MAVARHLQQPTRRATWAGRPEPARRQDALLFGLAPDGVYQAKPVTRPAGELLPHRFTLTTRRKRPFGGLLSVALAVELPRLVVNQHSILWSPDFPPNQTKA